MILFLLEDSTTMDKKSSKMESLRKLLHDVGHDARILDGRDETTKAELSPVQVAAHIEQIVMEESQVVGLILDLDLFRNTEYGGEVLDSLRSKIGSVQIKKTVIYSRMVASKIEYWSERLQVPEEHIFPRSVTRISDIVEQFSEFIED